MSVLQLLRFLLLLADKIFCLAKKTEMLASTECYFPNNNKTMNPSYSEETVWMFVLHSGLNKLQEKNTEVASLFFQQAELISMEQWMQSYNRLTESLHYLPSVCFHFFSAA